MKVAKERKSSVLASNAVHHRVDSLTSIVALFTIGGSYVFQDATWLDPVGGLLISLMVIKAGWGNTVTSLLELADTAVDNDIKTTVQNAATKALKALEDGEQVIVRDVQGMKSGQNYLMDIELAVPGAWAITRSRVVEEAVRKTVGEKVRGVKRVKIRFIPAEQEELTFSEEFVSQDTGANPEPESNGNGNGVAPGSHNYNHNHDHDHSHEDPVSRKKQ
jgi:divalent metal cation (Fe/Co/Zn/Cd) transporter